METSKLLFSKYESHSHEYLYLDNNFFKRSSRQILHSLCYLRISFDSCRYLFLNVQFIPTLLTIIAMLTTISPVSLEDSVQRTPELVVISFGTGLVCYSFVSERYTAALASRCLVDTLSFCEDVLNTKMKGTTKRKQSLNLAVYGFRKKRSPCNIVSYNI